jgi:hypothetical protein
MEFSDPVVFAVPTFVPTNKLFIPGLLKMRMPLRLYCVVALTTFAASVPAAVPMPLRLTSPLDATLIRLAPLVAMFKVPAPAEKIPVPASPAKLIDGATAVPCANVIAVCGA